MYRILFMLFFSLILPVTLRSQHKAVTFEGLKELQAGEPKLVVVLIQTGWCKYCHAMKNSMLENKEVIGVLKKDFYFIFLDAEEKRDIVFSGHRFKFKPTGIHTGIHELAEQLGTINGQITYPTLSFLNEKNEIIYQQDGFLKPDALAFLLKQVAKR